MGKGYSRRDGRIYVSSVTHVITLHHFYTTFTSHLLHSTSLYITLHRFYITLHRFYITSTSLLHTFLTIAHPLSLTSAPHTLSSTWSPPSHCHMCNRYTLGLCPVELDFTLSITTQTSVVSGHVHVPIVLSVVDCSDTSAIGLWMICLESFTR